jgi:hypothetical protein
VELKQRYLTCWNKGARVRKGEEVRVCGVWDVGVSKQAVVYPLAKAREQDINRK